LAPWAIGAQNGGEKGRVFVTGAMNLLFFVTEKISMKFGKKSVGVRY